jgi:hypothetical protein
MCQTVLRPRGRGRNKGLCPHVKNHPFYGWMIILVEVTGFEPATFWSRTKRATKLRYTSKNGADEGTRTPDLLITNRLLYQLSHIGTCPLTLENYITFHQLLSILICNSNNI